MVDGSPSEEDSLAFSNESGSLSQDVLVQVFDRINLATFVIDADHVICHWNSALEALSGLSRESMIGTKDQWRPFYNSPRPTMADLMIEGGRDEDVERFYQGKYRPSDLIPDAFEAEDFFPECGSGGEWLHFTAGTIRDKNGAVVGAIETLMNISGRKKAENELIAREENYRQLSITDALTGLYNSRYFYSQLDAELERCHRFNQTMSLAFLDLDDFKLLNDNFGHLFGDMVLEGVGTSIRANLRSVDGAFRYGGEEFALLLPMTDINGAKDLANRVCTTTAKRVFVTEDSTELNITISVGVTEYQKGDTSKAMLARADAALYKAKNLGKNQVVSFDNG